MDKNKYIKIPYWYLLATCLPIFLIAGFFPKHAFPGMWEDVNIFIDENLLGVVGFWSSNFPFSAKAITNYISFFGPVFGAVLFIWKIRELPKNAEHYQSVTIFKYIFSTIVLVVFYTFIIYVFYFSFNDMAIQKKARIFAMSEFVFSLYSSLMLMIYYLLFFMSYIIFVQMPKILYFRYFDK